jgi:spore maturation protein B
VSINYLSSLIFILIVATIPLAGAIKKINVYDSFLKGAKSGFDIVIKITPFLVGMVVAIGMLRASGAFELIATSLSPLLNKIGLEPDLLPLIVARPFSGAASNAVLIDIIKHHGSDSLIAHTAATIIGSTETTMYVVAVYFGAVSIKNTRHAIKCGLIADAAGIAASIIVCKWLLG